MKNLLFLSTLIITSFIGLTASAQTGVSIDMTYGSWAGMSKSAVTGQSLRDVEGNPYLYSAWLPGTAKLTDGKTYGDLFLKYDAVNNMLIFKYTLKDSALAFKYPPVEFTLTSPEVASGSMYFTNGFAPVDGGDDKTFYWVMAKGPVKLLKRVKKTIQSSHGEMNSNVVTRTVIESNSYYIAKGDKLTPIKNDKKSILNALSDQAADLQKFISENHLDLKNDEDLKQVIDHYNQIKKA